MAEDEETGSSLRQKLEDQISQTKQLTEQLAAYRAADVIEAGGLHLVQPEDLANVPLDKLEEQAQKLQSERQGVFEQALRRQFTQAGLEGDELEAQVKGLLTAPAATIARTDERSEQFRRVSQIGGAGAPPTVNPDTLSSLEKIELGLSKK